MYEEAKIAVDPVVFTTEKGKLKVLLHRRKEKPFKEKFELPGGLLRQDEKPEQRVNKKLSEMVDKQDIYVEQFGTFTEPDRDPRRRTISIGYIALVNNQEVENEEKWFDARDLPEMAFDHAEIISNAEDFLKNNLDKLAARQLMPEYFPLNNLQEVYETVEQRSYDNRNFRRRMTNQGIVEKTGKKQENVPHRPASLYKFTE